MDPQQARASLDEVRTREQQVSDAVAREGTPWWYPAGIAAVFLAGAVSTDLDDVWGTGWLGPVLDYGVPVAGIVAIAVLAAARYRSLGLRPRRLTGPFARGLLVLALAFLVVHIGLGTALRAAGVSWDNTISGVAATLVFLGGSLLLRRVAH